MPLHVESVAAAKKSTTHMTMRMLLSPVAASINQRPSLKKYLKTVVWGSLRRILQPIGKRHIPDCHKSGRPGR